MSMLRKTSGFIFLVACLILNLAPVRAEDGPVKVNATVLVASNQGTDFNLDNDAYRDQLIKLFSYSSYRQVHVTSVNLNRTERIKVDLPEGYELTLTLQGEEKKRVLVQAVIRKGNKQFVDTVLSILRPGVVFLGGPPVKDGALIIVLETGF